MYIRHRFGVFAALLLLVWGCGGGELSYNLINTGDIEIIASDPLGCGQSVQLVRGGVPPYSLAIQDTSDGSATLSKDGTLTGTVEGTVNFEVLDWRNHSRSGSISIVISVTASATFVARGATTTLTAAGCNPPHTFTTGGAGTVGLTSGLFTATSPGTALVTATDAHGKTGSKFMTVPFAGPDTTFNPNTGAFTYPVTYGGAVSPVLVRNSNDSVVLVGGNSAGYQFLKLNIDGTTPVPRATASTGSPNSIEITSAAQDPVTGDILAVGWTEDSSFNQSWVLLRQSQIDGELVTSFGTGGIAFYKPDANQYQYPRVWALANGKFLVAGYSVGANPILRLVQFTSNGTEDPDMQSIPLAGVNPSLGSPPGLLVDASGNILVAVSCQTGADDDVCIYKFDSVGAPVMAWGGGDGIAEFNNIGDELPSLLLMGQNSDIWFAAGQGAVASPIKMLRTGRISASTGLGLFTLTSLVQVGHNEFPRDLILGIDGRPIFMGGSLGASPAFVGSILRSDGAVLDSQPAGSFGNSARGATLLSDGRFLVAGADSLTSKWVLARFWP